MTENTKIAWAHHTLNRWIGCTKIAAGCTHCYAESENKRRGWMPGWGPKQPRHLVTNATWFKYRQWEKRAAATGRKELVFCGSLMDWCDHEAPPGALPTIWQGWRETPNLLWLMLTKRVGRIAASLPPDYTPARYPNVAFGYSIAEKKDLAKMDAFVRIPAAMRFISYEPAIEWCDLRPWLYPQYRSHWSKGYVPDEKDREAERALVAAAAKRVGWKPPITQVIVGGESGPKARPFDMAWAHSTVDDCKAAGVRVFVKQLGARPVVKVGSSVASVRLAHPKGEDPREWPAHLRVQEHIADQEKP